MTKREFAEELKLKLVERVESDIRISIEEVTRNNGVSMIGFLFKNSGSNMNPVIYVESYYKLFQGGMQMETIAEKIILLYTQSTIGRNIELEFLREWEKVKELIVFKLINTDMNKALLEKLPHKEILDLAMVFMVDIPEVDGSCIVNNELFNSWKIDMDLLKEKALENTMQRYPLSMKNLRDMIAPILGVDIPEHDLYVLSNETYKFGAAVILYPDVLARLAEQWQSDIYIIPDSVHQVLLCSSCLDENVKEWKEILARLNAEIDFLDDVLSGNVYKYERNTKMLKIVG